MNRINKSPLGDDEWFDDQEEEDYINDHIKETNHTPEESVEKTEDETDYFSDSLFEKLPPFLCKAIQPYETDRRERDIMLFSSIIASSACFSTIVGEYRGEMLHPNLYGIVLAPPASGKGRAKSAANLVSEIHDKIASSFRDGKDQIDMQKISRAGLSISKSFRISGNSSSASLIEQMKENESIGTFMFETELDVIVSATKQDWGGGYSEMLRKCFHHEMVSSGRIISGNIEIKKPKLSLLATGTPNQLNGFVRGIGDGLFSRVFFYRFDSESEWKNVQKGVKGEPQEKYYDGLSKELLEIFEWYRVKSIDFSFTDSQFDEFNAKFKADLSMITAKFGSESASIVFRAGPKTFRIAMILSALRSFGREVSGGKIECEEADFKCAMSISKTLMYHSLGIFKEIHGAKFKKENELKEKFYSILPSDEFKKDKAIEIGDSIKIPDRTISSTLRDWVDSGRLVQPRYGHYRKT